MAAGIGLAIAGAGLQGIGLVNSYFDKKKAEEEAARLAGIPIEEYGLGADILEQRRIASGMFANPQGFTPQETARFDNNINKTLAKQNYNATQVGGGGVGRVISGIGNSSAVNAATDFAASDASLRRSDRNMALSKMYNIANKAQSLKDMNTQFRLNRRLMAEQAAGRGIQTNKDYINGALMGIGQDLVGAGLTKELTPKTPTTGVTGKTMPTNSIYGGRRINPNLLNNMPPNFTSADIPTITTPRRTSFEFPDTQGLYNFRTGRYE